MADSLSDVLTATLRTVFLFNRTNQLELGNIQNATSQVTTYAFADGAGPQQADLVYAETRTIPPNTMETIDLLDLEQPTLGVDVAFEFRQLRAVRIVNHATVAGRRLLVGVNPGSPTSIYAAAIGPASEWHAVNHVDSWVVTADNQLFRISNPNAAAINYSLYLFGTSTPVPEPEPEEEE